MAGAARRNWLIWVAVLPVALWAPVRLLGLDSGFPLVAMMAFTPWVAVLALLLAGVAVALENWAAAALAALTTVALAAVVLPRALGDATVPIEGHRTIRVLGANAYVGKADPHALLDLADRLDVDVLAVEELTPALRAGLRRAGVRDLLPEAEIALREGTGSAIYSRLPLASLDEGRVFTFPMPRVSLALPGGGAVRIVAVHPITPTRHGTGTWEETLAALPSAGHGVPWVLAGDFNATLDDSALRDLISRGYRDAADVAGLGLIPTWPRNRAVGPLITIDHVLADRRLGVVSYSVEELRGSDHRAVFAELRLP